MEKWLNRLLKYPKTILLVVLVISIAFFVVMKKNSRMETNLDKYMPEKHPAFVYSNQAEKWFNIKDGIIIAIENKDGIFNQSTLKKVKELTKKLQHMKEIKKNDVTSLYTADNIVGQEGSLNVTRFYRRVPADSAGLAEIKRKVEGNEMIFGRLVSPDETVTVVVARIDNSVFSQDFYHRILSLAKAYEGPEKIYVAGRPIVEGTMAYLGPRDMKRMVPIVIVVIILVLFLVLRNVTSTLFTLLVVLFSTIWAFGLMAALHVPIYAVSTMIPVMLIAIGVAYGVHLYSHLYLHLQEHPDATRQEAVRNMIHEMWQPVMMAAVTTMIGFVSLLTSQVYPIKDFGIFTAFGVLAAFVLSMLLIPAGILAFGLPRGKKNLQNNSTEEKESRFATRFADEVVRYKGVTYAVTLLIVGISFYGMTKVWINSSFLAKFEKNSDIVKTDHFINAHFGGTSTLNVILEGKTPDTFKRPAVLQWVVNLQKAVEDSLPVVGNSFSLGDYLTRMNRVMHADSEKYDAIPNNQNLIAQYLLLYEMSGNPENLWQVVTEDFKKLNVTFQLKSDGSKALKRTIAIIDRYKPAFQKMGISVHYAGSGYKALVFTDLILQGQIYSLLMSLVIVVILLSLMFKKVSIGLIGSIPIAITTVISFGVMGLLGIPLSTTTALISSIAIGIGIDYAVHFIDRYRFYSSENHDKAQTGHLTMYHSGRAILFNAVVVIAGFLVLLFSVFPPNRTLGALVSLNMFTSFVGTVTIMFVVLYGSNIYFKRKKESDEARHEVQDMKNQKNGGVR